MKGGDKESRDHSPLYFFKLFWDGVIVNTFLRVMNAFTNKNQSNRASKYWSVDDFGAFLGLILHFGVVKYPPRIMP